jgi:hypothetical protein
MRRKIKKFFSVGTKFKKEFKRQLRMLLTFTFGFTIAFTWRETIFKISQSIVNFFLHFESTNISNIFTSIFITLICILLIYLSSNYLKDSYENC